MTERFLCEYASVHTLLCFMQESEVLCNVCRMGRGYEAFALDGGNCVNTGPAVSYVAGVRNLTLF